MDVIADIKKSVAHSSLARLEFLAFTLGDQEYGIDIQKVLEIRSYETVTRIASAPIFVKGIINLRGVIVPIVDMRIKFDLGTPVYDEFTVVVVLNINNHVIGIVVDRVSDVIRLTEENIKAAPDVGSGQNNDYVIGLGSLDQRMLILVDIDKLMSGPDMGLIDTLAD